MLGIVDTFFFKCDSRLNENLLNRLYPHVSLIFILHHSSCLIHKKEREREKEKEKERKRKKEREVAQ